jgi:beta-glucanase (GH16 family)
MKYLPGLLFLLLVRCTWAGPITFSSTPKGIVLDQGATGQYTLSGPMLSFPKEGDDKKTTTIKPLFVPGPDGLGGTIDYPQGPGNPRLRYRISPADQTITFTWEQLSPAPVSVDFEMEFLAGQFFGGLYAIGDKPPTPLPIDPLPRGEYFHDTSFSLAGRDGMGLTIKTPAGGTSFGDNRKYNGPTYAWRHQQPFKSTEKSLVVGFSEFKTTPPTVVLKPDGPPADGKWEKVPELSDEFDGDALDSSKWWDHNPGWAGRSPSYFAADNVRVADGKLQLIARLQDPPESLKPWPSFKNYSTASVVSKTPALYGYYEVKAKVMALDVDSAFWFYTPLPAPASNQHVEELDVFEIAGGGGAKFDRTLFNTMHVWKTPEFGDKRPWAKAVEFRAPARLADDYHVYGMEWDKDQIKCYFDGYLFARYANTNWHYPLSLLFDNEIQPQWFGTPPPQGFSGTFNVEYVRAWRRADQPVSATGPAQPVK